MLCTTSCPEQDKKTPAIDSSHQIDDSKTCNSISTFKSTSRGIRRSLLVSQLPLEIAELLATHLDYKSYLNLRTTCKYFARLNPCPVLSFEMFQLYYQYHTCYSQEIILHLSKFNDEQFLFLAQNQLSTQFCKALNTHSQKVSHKVKSQTLDDIIEVPEFRDEQMIICLVKKLGQDLTESRAASVVDWACEFGSLPVLECLEGINRNFCNGYSILLACTSGSETVLGLLLGRTIEGPKDLNSTLLKVTAATGSWACIRVQLDYWIEDTGDLGSILALATYSKATSIVYQILGFKGLRLDNINHYVLLSQASYDTDLLKVLLQDSRIDPMSLFLQPCKVSVEIAQFIYKRIDQSKNNRRILLQHSIKSKNIKVLNWLIDNTVNNLERLFLLAIRSGDTESINLLIEKGARVQTKQNEALFMSIELPLSMAYNVMTLLLGKVDMHARNGAAFKLVILNGHTELLEIMLKQNGRRRWMTKSFLASAVGPSNSETMKMALEDGRFDPTWKTPGPELSSITNSDSDEVNFYVACKSGKTDIVEYLLRLTDIDPAKNFSKALYYAVKGNHVSLVKLLIKDGRVDPNSRNILGRSSRQGVSYAILRSLLSHPKAKPNSALSDAGSSYVVEIILSQPKFMFNRGCFETFKVLCRHSCPVTRNFFTLIDCMYPNTRVVALRYASLLCRWNYVAEILDYDLVYSFDDLSYIIRHALKTRLTDIYRKLLKKFEFTDEFRALLSIQEAIQDDRCEVVETLLGQSSIAFLEMEDYWLMHMVASYGRVTMAKMIFSKGFKLPVVKQNDLLGAAINGIYTLISANHFSMVKYLLSFNGMEPSYYIEEAIATGRDEIVDVMMADMRTMRFECEGCGNFEPECFCNEEYGIHGPGCTCSDYSNNSEDESDSDCYECNSDCGDF